MTDRPDVAIIHEYDGDRTQKLIAELPKEWYRRIVIVGGQPSTDPEISTIPAGDDPVRFLGKNGEKPPGIVVFLGGKCDPKQLGRIVGPVLRNEFPAAVGSRRMRNLSPGTIPWPISLWNSLACLVIRLTTGKVYTDISPFRAMTWETLQKTSPHPLPMQFKAPRARLKVLEVPIDYHR